MTDLKGPTVPFYRTPTKILSVGKVYCISSCLWD